MRTARFKRKIAACATSFAALVGALATAGPAEAAEYTVMDNCDVPWITCSYGDLWLFYNSKDIAVQDGYYKSAFTMFYSNVSDHWGTSQYQGSSLSTYRYVFGNGGNGNGQYMKNNAASVQNCARDDNYRVYYNSGYGGTSQYFAKNGPYGDCNITDLISALKNNNASSHFA
ncbi:hypothetical protein [Streptomyces fumanus]|uniref:Peptidase inhibitor family I36 n=1 Tax=Streptomyces fumanus TaxID=67302 RepID=A0A919E8I5_9ACTN|nr:hypothetical protein [Streptomyces fumanus]GHF24561.1 hypothetical protein GCM10018772_57920 [Streptomyces fumanus]